MPTYNEIGASGLRQFAGFIDEAYNKELKWPSVQPLYSRMRRSDPEITAVRNVMVSLSRSVSFHWDTPDKPTDGDKKAQEFAESIFEDVYGGSAEFMETLVSQVPFFGWGWWEVLPGYRDPKWAPPAGDEWRSQYNDKKIGIRRLAWRDTSSFWRWNMDPANGRLLGMWQWVYPNPQVLLPIENSLHLTMGDSHNPEGMSPLEAVWRLERIKYGLEVVQGIGFEHAAGYLDIIADQKLEPSDAVIVKQIAKAIMSAQEGNYAAWPKGVTGEIKSVDFAAAASILDAIKYFGILKFQVFNMQWMALSATTGSGSYKAMEDSSSMFVKTYNAMLEGFARQMDAQIGKRLFKWNEFPGMTTRPKLKIDTINKIPLNDLASILGTLNNLLPMGDDDFIAIRKQLEFLPETLPVEDKTTPPPPVVPPTDNMPMDNGNMDQVSGDQGAGDQTTQNKGDNAAQTVSQSIHDARRWYTSLSANEKQLLEGKA